MALRVLCVPSLFCYGGPRGTDGDTKQLIGGLVASPTLAGLGFLLIDATILRHRLKRVPIVTKDVEYELTNDRVRARSGGYSRELMLTDIDRVECMSEPNLRGIGHVVFCRRGYRGQTPAIPLEGLKNDGKTVDGELTFWLVANPHLVRDRVLEVKHRFDPDAKGPYR